MKWYFLYDPKTGEYLNAVRSINPPQFSTNQDPTNLINPVFDMKAGEWNEASSAPPTISTVPSNAELQTQVEMMQAALLELADMSLGAKK